MPRLAGARRPRPGPQDRWEAVSRPAFRAPESSRGDPMVQATAGAAAELSRGLAAPGRRASRQAAQQSVGFWMAEPAVALIVLATRVCRSMRRRAPLGR